MSESPEGVAAAGGGVVKAGLLDDDLNDDEVTFAASSDVVDLIRQQAAELRANAAEQPAEVEAEPVDASAAFDAADPTAVMDRAPVAPSAPAAARSVKRPVVQAESLIAGMAPPASSTSYWDPSDVAPTQPVDQIAHAKKRVPMWMIIAALIVLAIVISVVVAFLITSTPSTPVAS